MSLRFTPFSRSPESLKPASAVAAGSGANSSWIGKTVLMCHINSLHLTCSSWMTKIWIFHSMGKRNWSSVQCWSFRCMISIAESQRYWGHSRRLNMLRMKVVHDKHERQRDEGGRLIRDWIFDKLDMAFITETGHHMTYMSTSTKKLPHSKITQTATLWLAAAYAVCRIRRLKLRKRCVLMPSRASTYHAADPTNLQAPTIKWHHRLVQLGEQHTWPLKTIHFPFNRRYSSGRLFR